MLIGFAPCRLSASAKNDSEDCARTHRLVERKTSAVVDPIDRPGEIGVAGEQFDVFLDGALVDDV